MDLIQTIPNNFSNISQQVRSSGQFGVLERKNWNTYFSRALNFPGCRCQMQRMRARYSAARQSLNEDSQDHLLQCPMYLRMAAGKFPGPSSSWSLFFWMFSDVFPWFWHVVSSGFSVQDLGTTASTSNHFGQRLGLCLKTAETRLHFQRRLDADWAFSASIWGWWN